jgi:hypothetical protein
MAAGSGPGDGEAWRVERVDRGVVLVAPEGPGAGQIWCVRDAGPLRSLGRLARDAVRRLGLDAARLGAPERLVTLEGEHAALVAIAGRLGGRPARVRLGAVFGDDRVTTFAGAVTELGHEARLDAMVRDRIARHAMGLGVRRRRYVYAPPPGWQALVRGPITDWIAPAFPDEWAVVVVYPADPASARAAGILPALRGQAAAHGFVAEREDRPIALTSDGGLEGVRLEAVGVHRGARVLRVLAGFLDARYIYALELQSRCEPRWDEHRAAFEALCRSIEPVPARCAPADALRHWVE